MSSIKGSAQKTAFIVIDLYPKDIDKLREYRSLADETLVEFGGEFLARGPIQTLHGGSAFLTKIVIQFPNRSLATGWYNSKAYQQIIPIRDQAMDSRFHLVG